VALTVLYVPSLLDLTTGARVGEATVAGSAPVPALIVTVCGNSFVKQLVLVKFIKRTWDSARRRKMTGDRSTKLYRTPMNITTINTVPTPACASQFKNNYFAEMCRGSEAGSYLRLIHFVYPSTLGLRVTKKRRSTRLYRTPMNITTMNTVPTPPAVTGVHRS